MPVAGNLVEFVAALGAPTADDARLPPLREDVGLHRAKREGGVPGWLLEDPASNSFFHIGWIEFEILARWSLGDRDEVIAAVNRDTTARIDVAMLDSMLAFLGANGLLRVASERVVAERRRQRQAVRRMGPGGWISQHLLFVRFPLFCPERFLASTVPIVAPLYSRRFLALMFAILLLALYLLSRQWQSAVAGLATIYSLEGIVASSVAIIIAKSLHELSHAWSASRHGVPVPVMGVALLLFWPVLYTETSGAWVLQDGRKRIEIAAAGVAAEFALGIIALLVWSLMDDGPLRNAMIFSATTLLVMTVLFNANPLMKFDGYFVLTELCGIENLQARALALMQWSLRRWLVGLDLPTPEPGFSLRRSIAVGLYGAALALYRVFLFGGICFAIYLMTWPFIAIPISVAVIAAFLVRPIMVEIMTWFKLAMRAGKPLAMLRSAAIVAVLALPLVVPWRQTLVFPAVVEPGQPHQLFASEGARVARVLVREGSVVEAGSVLAELISPDIERSLSLARYRVEMLRGAIDRRLTRVGLHDDLAVRNRELMRLRAQVEGLEARQRRLQIRATLSGRVRYLSDALQPGVWVPADEPLIEIVAPARLQAVGYIDERDLGSIRIGAAASVWFDGLPHRSERYEVVEINAEAVGEFDQPLLAAQYGGPVPVRHDSSGKLVPERGLYKVRLEPVARQVPAPGEFGPMPARAGGSSANAQKSRAFVRAEAQARSFAAVLVARVLALWRREFG